MSVDLNALNASLLTQWPVTASSTPSSSVTPDLTSASETTSRYLDKPDPAQSAIVSLGAGNTAAAGLYNAQGLMVAPEVAQMNANQDPVAYWVHALPVNPAMLPTLLQQQANQNQINLIA